MSPKKLRAKLVDLHGMLAEQFPIAPLDEEWFIAFDWAAGPIPFACYCEINPEAQGFVFRAIWQTPIAKKHRAAVAEYLHRANYALPIVGWSIDLESGDLRWKSGFFFGDGDLTDNLMIQVLDSSFAFIREYVMGLVKLANGATIAEAIAAVGEDPGESTIGE